MISQFLGERKNPSLATEHPPGSSSSDRCKDGARRNGTSQPECSDQRTQIDLFYSASGPDMFALVTSILQEHKEPEAPTEWESESESSPPSWIMDLENSSRYSNFSPMNIWDYAYQAYLAESRSSYEEKLEKAPSTEPLIRKLNLQVTGSCTLPCPSPPSHEILTPSNPQNEGFTCQDLNQQFGIIPECNKTYLDAIRGDHFSSQVCVERYGEHPEGMTRGVLGASYTEEPMPLPHSATGGIWVPVIQENQMCAQRCTYESPQFVPMLPSPFQQQNSIPQGANTQLYQNQQQYCPVNPGTLSNNLKNPAYPFPDSSNHLRPPPGFEQQSLPYSGDQYLRGVSSNLSRAPCVTYNRPQQMNATPWESPANSSVIQPFCSQAAPQQWDDLQNCGFSNYKENVRSHYSVAPPWVDLQTPQSGCLGEISTNIPPPGWPGYPPANRFANYRSLDGAPNGDQAGQETAPCDRQAKMNPASVGPDCTQMDVLRNQKKMCNLFEFINPAFFPFYQLAEDGSQIPNFSAFHLPPFSCPRPPFPVNCQNGNIPDLSSVINGDTSLLYHMLPALLAQQKEIPDQVESTHTLYMQLEECCQQWRALERERSQMEADLARSFPRKTFAMPSVMPYFRLPPNPSRVDRLIWIQFQEQAKVCILLEKMEYLFGVSIHDNILATLRCHLEAIRTTQARRMDELLSSHTYKKSGSSNVSSEKDILALATAVDQLIITTRKTRTALWSAFQHIVFPKDLTRIPGQNASDLVSTPLQTKNLPEGRGK